MATMRWGTIRIDGLDEIEHEYHYNPCTGMEVEAYGETEHGWLFGTMHDGVGLLTWYVSDTEAEVTGRIEKMMAKHEVDCPAHDDADAECVNEN